MSNSQRHPRPRIHPLLRFHAKHPNFFADVAAQQAELIALRAENAALRTENTALRAENTTLWSMITILQAELIALRHTMKLADRAHPHHLPPSAPPTPARTVGRGLACYQNFTRFRNAHQSPVQRQLL